MRLLSNIDFCMLLQKYPIGSIGCLDFGSTAVGIAVCDSSRRFFHPLGTVSRKYRGSTKEATVEVMYKTMDMLRGRGYNSLSGMVIGLPLIGDQEMTPFCHQINNIVTKAGVLDYTSNNETGPPNRVAAMLSSLPPVCTYWHEYNSTADAKAYLRETTTRRSVRMAQKDSVAAAIILENFLEHPEVLRFGIRETSSNEVRTDSSATSGRGRNRRPPSRHQR